MKPKLLYISPQNPYPPIDGGKIGIYYPVLYLSKYFELYFAFIYNNQTKDIEGVKKHFSELGIYTIPFYKDTTAGADLKHLLINPFKKEPFKWDKYYSKKFLKVLESIISREEIKYVLISHSHMGKYGIKLKQRFPFLKIFLREHNIEFSLIEQYKDFTKNPLYKFIAKWQLEKSKKIETWYWNFVDKVFFISDTDYNIAMSYISRFQKKDKFHVLYDGYEISKSLEGICTKYNNISFIYTANLKTIQNLISFRWFIKEIWIPLQKVIKEKNIKLYITGNSNNIIAKALNTTNLEGLNLINLGFVENIDEEILKHKYVLSPTIIGSGIRLKVLNGLALGKPVFLTPLDLSTCKAFKDMENVVCFNTKEEFIQKLLKLETNDNIYYQISKKALETISNYFNWNNYAKTIYKEFIKCGN